MSSPHCKEDVLDIHWSVIYIVKIMYISGKNFILWVVFLGWVVLKSKLSTKFLRIS